MHQKLEKLFNDLKKAGLTPEQEEKFARELDGDLTHAIPVIRGNLAVVTTDAGEFRLLDLYDYHDLMVLQALAQPKSGYISHIRSIDELLEKDRQREKDGFPRKIRVGKMIKPGKAGKGKVVVVPTTVEEKFIHDPRFTEQEEGEGQGGSGDGEEGEVIGEQPVRDPDQAGAGGPGEGEGGQHEMESSAYDLGRILTEQFELPNLQDKGKKRSLTRYTYDMTDRNRGFGQVLDKKATLREIVETNIHLGNIPDMDAIDPSRFIISPKDKIYRILSKEKDFESQAVVFFVRDYSGSMAGKATELVVTQHVLIYSWLLYQYAHQVESRFILHDTEAKEVEDFYTYYNSKVAGGTQVFSAYEMVNRIVKEENLAADYNIYVFHGTDGDDWDTEGKKAIPALKEMFGYASRIGITIAEHTSSSKNNTEVERYLKKSGVLEKFPKLIRLDVLNESADEPRLIEGIKKLIS
ncbi:DUF444 family protein [Desulfosarcina ovata]|uniref:DUF444 family protein n=2 Tax=Desulfosarcina ovata TaxID=83564 RepID=A0A5K8AE03_9BACT|nr:DUF444 family protein [Desulfosarcina ovata]BBO84295.1 hypothetical protein DSCO28_48610 [Desulfosarcina ovata subsp. sediminis]BBO90807.1 hypothetical protein DSCOOX_39870 [Desulfosarcina ovata subsp. ovata]